MNTALKIVMKMDNEKQINLYFEKIGMHLMDVNMFVMERMQDIDKNVTLDSFRKYWIDQEQDFIEIIKTEDFDFFITTNANKIPKIYFELIQRNQASPKIGPRHIHPTVECDVCLKAPISGFRYKCLQCPNFDLCMKCESEMKHPEHLMLRIPSVSSPKLEHVYNIFGKSARRQQKHAARAAAAANAAAFAAGPSATETKSHHHRNHHRKHCAAAAGLFSNFYDMMQDFAEGGASAQQSDEATSTTKNNSQEPTPTPSQPGTPIEEIISSAAKEAAAVAASAASAAAAAAAASAANNFTVETNISTDTQTTSNARAQTSPTAEGIPISPSLEKLIDPQLMKAGIKILNNFSEMFGKILDPVVTEGASRNSSASSSVNIDLTKENGASSTPTPTAAATPNKPGTSGQSSNVGSGLVTPMETEGVANEPVQSRSRNSQSEENDWTMIDNNVASGSDALGSSNVTAPAATASTSNAAPIDFAKLSKQLQTHIENEMKSTSAPTIPPTQTHPPAQAFTPTSDPISNPPSPPTSIPTGPTNPENSERRAIAVFHADPRINSAVHGMMAMGFSNEGAVLTQLLESVNGSIPLALDLMSAAQSN